MVQVILKAAFNAGWGGSAQYFSIAGEGQIPYSTTFGPNSAVVLVPIDGTFKNLTVYCAAAHPSYTLTLMVNGSPTTLSAGIASSDTIASNLASIVSVSAGDYVSIRIVVNPPGTGSGYPVAVAIEFEGDEQFYGIQPFSGSVSAVTPGISARRGGLLGNGDYSIQPWPISPTLANFYSICSVNGTITKFAIRSFAALPGTGVWSAYIIHNQILQDGTGGSVDTELTLTGTDVADSRSVSLPIVLGDHVEVVVRRTVANSSFALANIAASIAFMPTSPDTFMNTGGSNYVVSPTVVGWRWNHSEQLAPLEVEHNVPISLRGINVTGLYVEITGMAIPLSSYTYMLRKNGADTGVTFTITYPNRNGQITGLDIDYEFGDTMTLQITPSAVVPNTTSHYWGLISVVEEEESEGGIYQMVPGKTDDTIYSGDDTVDVKIPDPYFKTGVLGE